MKRISWTLGILLTLALLIAAGCSGEDPIKVKQSLTFLITMVLQ
ncbi:hypothetical protein [Porphyromonas endodontalis]|nr:hypothetical protein [Porphyromonas endodontalis]